MKIKLFFVTSIVTISILTSITSVALACSVTSEVHLIDDNGVKQSIGTVTFTDTDNGLQIKTDLKGLPPGEHGFHIHEGGSCGPAEHDGHLTAGLQAHGHYDPDKTGKHEGPLGNGHKGDLPKLIVKADGIAKETLLAPRLKVKEIKGLTVMIHAGGDNYSDKPLPLGGGGARIACGVIPN